MRKLVLKMSLSADGFVGGPNGELDFLFSTMDKSAIEWINITLRQAGVHIMGRRTFHDMAAYWPGSSDLLAPAMNEIPKIVFSRKGSLDPVNSATTTQAIIDKTNFEKAKGIVNPGATEKTLSTWVNPEIAGRNLAEDISRLKKQDGRFILAHGGADFAQSLVQEGLIDEYRLLIHPVAIGKGLPLFSRLPKQMKLKLESSTALNSGILANVYTPFI